MSFQSNTLERMTGSSDCASVMTHTAAAAPMPPARRSRKVNRFMSMVARMVRASVLCRAAELVCLHDRRVLRQHVRHFPVRQLALTQVAQEVFGDLREVRFVADLVFLGDRDEPGA